MSFFWMCNEIEGLYDIKTIITTVQSYAGKISLICYCWYCCCWYCIVTLYGDFHMLHLPVNIHYDNWKKCSCHTAKELYQKTDFGNICSKLFCVNNLSFKVCIFQVVKSPHSFWDCCYCYHRHVRMLWKTGPAWSLWNWWDSITCSALTQGAIETRLGAD